MTRSSEQGRGRHGFYRTARRNLGKKTLTGSCFSDRVWTRQAHENAGHRCVRRPACDLQLGYETTRASPRYPPNNAKTLCGVVLAIANTLVPAFTRICARVRLDVSTAKSVSRMADSADVRFSNVICN